MKRLSTDVPALDHDDMMLVKFGQGVSAEGRLERRIVWNLCAHLEAAGFQVYRTFDGEEMRYPKTAKGAMELIFNLDEASLRFIHVSCIQLKKNKSSYEHGVLLVLGNGIDIISDWNYTEGDPDGFSAAMDKFNAEDYA